MSIYIIIYCTCKFIRGLIRIVRRRDDVNDGRRRDCNVMRALYYYIIFFLRFLFLLFLALDRSPRFVRRRFRVNITRTLFILSHIYTSASICVLCAQHYNRNRGIIIIYVMFKRVLSLRYYIYVFKFIYISVIGTHHHDITHDTSCILAIFRIRIRPPGLSVL